MGLDPRENREKREREKAKQNEPPPLDPPFPYRVMPFDPWTFDVEADPPPSSSQLST
jgi:hypothetical protein